jgi:hypothetical protein
LLGALVLGTGVYLATKNSVAEAEESKIQVEIPFGHTLGEGEMQTLKVGPKDEDKILISRY